MPIRSCLLLIAAVLLSLLLARPPSVIALQDVPPTLIPPDQTIIEDLFQRMVALRTRIGRAPYRRHPALDAAAQAQAEWLVATGLRGHVRPDGSRPSDRAAAAGYTGYRCCGENYYMSIDATPDIVWDFWTWSWGHYANLASADFDEVGIGWSSNGTRHSYVLVFGESWSETAAAAPPTPATLTPPPTQATDQQVAAAPEATALPPEAGQRTHIVQPGENLFRIALRYSTTVSAIATANGILDPTFIYVGQELVIP